ncbi:MAG: 16S rRNA (cytosine(967)-C(5))-methyltransferase RsmB [Thermacetogeniaceae bacterium]
MLLSVERKGAYANLALQKLMSAPGAPWARRPALEARDAGLLTELVYGVLRRQNTLDWVIDQFSKVPVARMNYITRNIVRLGVYQLLFLERVPVSAACNESVELAKTWRLGDLSGFVNGLLRNIARRRDEISYPDPDQDPVLHISVKYSHPVWLVERWLQRFGQEETIALCRANNEPPPVVLRCNTLRIDPQGLLRMLEQEGIAVRPSPLIPEAVRVAPHISITGLPSFRAGCFAVQDESSMLASLVLRPQPGSMVVDACAGPGGKTTHLAQLMENCGRLLAFDVHPHRLRLIADACRRLGVTIVSTRLQDAATPPEDTLGLVDYLLVDAPCSGLGVIRRRPDLRWKAQAPDLAAHARQQKQILNGISKCLKTGGIMLYSTCSTEPEENGDVVAAFLSSHDHWETVDISRLAPPSFLIDGADRRMAEQGRFQLLPHRHGTDGFFLAALRKVG